MASSFEQECRQAARGLRRLPADLRRELAREVRDDVAEPLAGEIRAAFTGPWAAVLAAGTKSRVQGDPMVVVGGARRVLSGGGSVRSVVFGDEFGGGKRVTPIPARDGRRGYRRRTTRQFAGAGRGSVFGTIAAGIDRTFDRWATTVERITDRSLDNNG